MVVAMPLRLKSGTQTTHTKAASARELLGRTRP